MKTCDELVIGRILPNSPCCPARYQVPRITNSVRSGNNCKNFNSIDDRSPCCPVTGKNIWVPSSDAGRWITLGVPVVIGGDNLPSPVGIGLTALPNIGGGGSGPPYLPRFRHHWNNISTNQGQIWHYVISKNPRFKQTNKTPYAPYVITVKLGKVF